MSFDISKKLCLPYYITSCVLDEDKTDATELSLSKKDIFTVIQYVKVWPTRYVVLLCLWQKHVVMHRKCKNAFMIRSRNLFVVYRQCMCCFRELKNYEKFGNVVQAMLHKAIELIHTLASSKLSNKHGGQGG